MRSSDLYQRRENTGSEAQEKVRVAMSLLGKV